jgi:hypothetical protein
LTRSANGFYLTDGNNGMGYYTAGEVLVGFGERAIRHQRLGVAHPDPRRELGVVQLAACDSNPASCRSFVYEFHREMSIPGSSAGGRSCAGV